MEQNEQELLHYALKGDREAIQFCNILFQLSQVWDDLVDRDKEVPPNKINAAFWSALVTLPSNQFYLEFLTHLRPLIEASITDWLDANELQNTNDEDLVAAAFVLRDSLTGIIIHCARLIGGYEWSRIVSKDIRRFIYKSESLASFKEEHGCQAVTTVTKPQ